MRELKTKLFVVSPGALDCVARSGERIEILHRRHLGGDWGEGQDAREWQESDAAKESGGTVLSIFVLRNGERLWIMTDGFGVTRAVCEAEYVDENRG